MCKTTAGSPPPQASHTGKVPIFVHLHHHPLHLSLARPDALNQTITLGQAVQGIVGLAHGTDEAAEGVDVVLAGDSTAGLVNLGDRDLDGGVVLGLDDTVGGRALAGDVAIRRKKRGGSVRFGHRSSGCRTHARPPLPAHFPSRVALTGPRSRHGRSPFWRLGLRNLPEFGF